MIDSIHAVSKAMAIVPDANVDLCQIAAASAESLAATLA